jgi:hypothetical protein
MLKSLYFAGLLAIGMAIGLVYAQTAAHDPDPATPSVPTGQLGEPGPISQALKQETITIINAKSNEHCIGVDGANTRPGAYIKLFRCDSNPNQHWIQKDRTSDGYLGLQNQKSRLCIGVDKGSSTPGANLRQFKCDSRANQKWKFTDGLSIQNLGSKLCIGVSRGNVEHDVQLKQFPCDNKPNQHWRLIG